MWKFVGIKEIKRSRIIFILVVIVVVIFLLALFLFKGDKENVFSKTIPDGLGVNIHFTGKQVDIDMISDAGFKMVRTDLFWSTIETKKGVYDFKTFGYDTLTSELIKEDIRPYYVLAYINELYEEHGEPIETQKGRDAFNKYVNEATERYKNKEIIWEVWNEPNLNFDVNEYSLLLKQTSKTIKENDPSGTVVAPALAGLSEESLEWLEELFKKDVLEYVDAISVHPYRSWEPESVAYEYNVLRELIKKYSSKPIPIISGEWGYSTGKGWYGLNLSEEEQAAYLVRMYMVNQINNIPINIWYGWEDDGSDPNNGEHNFGIRKENTAISKLAYSAINTFTYILSDYQLIERIETGTSDDYILKFMNEKKEMVLVMWTIGDKHEISVPLEKAKGEVMNMLGQGQEYYNSDSNPKIEISGDPIYLIVE